MPDDAKLMAIVRRHMTEATQEIEREGGRLMIAATVIYDEGDAIGMLAGGHHSYLDDQRMFVGLHGINMQVGRFLENRLLTPAEDVIGPGENRDSTADAEKIVVN